MKTRFARALRWVRHLVPFRSPNKNRILVFATTAIGDSVMMSSCIRFLGDAGYEILLVASHSATTILGNHPSVKKIFPYRRGWFRALRLVWPLWKLNCKHALVLHVSDSAAWMLASISAESEVFCGQWLDYKGRAFDIRWIDDSSALHVAEKHCLVASAALSLGYNYELRNEIFNCSIEIQSERCFESSRPLIGLVPGARNFYKCWPVENFLQLGTELENLGFSVVVFGTQHESHLIEPLMNDLKQPFLFEGTLEDTFAALRELACVVSNDTGLMHVADALNCPVVGLFSATPAFQTRPLNIELSRVVHKPVTCFPSTEFRITETMCYNKTCQNPVCMRQIEVSEVLDLVLELTNKKRPSSTDVRSISLKSFD